MKITVPPYIAAMTGEDDRKRYNLSDAHVLPANGGGSVLFASDGRGLVLLDMPGDTPKSALRIPRSLIRGKKPASIEVSETSVSNGLQKLAMAATDLVTPDPAKVLPVVDDAWCSFTFAADLMGKIAKCIASTDVGVVTVFARTAGTGPAVVVSDRGVGVIMPIANDTPGIELEKYAAMRAKLGATDVETKPPKSQSRAITNLAAKVQQKRASAARVDEGLLVALRQLGPVEAVGGNRYIVAGEPCQVFSKAMYTVRGRDFDKTTRMILFVRPKGEGFEGMDFEDRTIGAISRKDWDMGVRTPKAPSAYWGVAA